MIQPEAYDAFYKDARARLLLQTYALTGDLPAARSAVRDSFIVTWHHWRKVSRLADAESWVRPHAWAQAQRRHTARIWHRDKSLAPETRATFDALGALSLAQRKALVLDLTTQLPMTDRARELGVPLGEAERLTTGAVAAFCVERGVTADRLPELFGALAALTADTRLPRPSILRRAGAARRRTHTAVGAAVAVAAVIVTGTVVSGSTIEGLPTATGEDGAAETSSSGDPIAAFTPSRLLEADEIDRYVGGRGWVEGETSDNSEGSGRVAPCQQERYADPKGVSTLVRTFEEGSGRGRADVSAVQYAELSATTRDSQRAWQRMLRWYGGCVTPQTQLLDTHTVTGIGDEAKLFELRSWRGTGENYLVGVARTGQIVTTTLVRTPGDEGSDLQGATRLLGGAVDGLCSTTPNARCTTRPKLRDSELVKVGEAPGLLIEADLPPVTGNSRPWVGTEPREARSNTAATRCDRTAFTAGYISRAATRTFLIPRSSLPPAFGITETVGSMPEARAAAFVDGVRDKMASCADRDLGSEVSSIATVDTADTDVSMWRVTSELGDDETVTYMMAIVRTGGSVGQIGFVPARGVEMAPGAFDALVRRALARLEHLPGKRQR